MTQILSTIDYAAIIDRLERFADGTQDNFPGNSTNLRAVISLLREAANAEPIAWLSIDCMGERYLCFTRPQDNDLAYPLFTHPASLVLRELVDAKPDAWITEDGERVVTAQTMQTAVKDGGAILSSLRPYLVPLFRHPASPPKPAVVRQSLFMDEERLYTYSTPGFVGQIEAAKKDDAA